MPRETRRSGKPEWQKRITRERILKLFEEAEGRRERPGFAKRYVDMAVKLSMRYNVSIPSHLKRRFCRKCHSYLASGNSTVRTNPKQRAVIVKCGECGNVMRYPYRKEKERK
jgi:ribonuclease P protein subunit RPR2